MHTLYYRLQLCILYNMSLFTCAYRPYIHIYLYISIYIIIYISICYANIYKSTHTNVHVFSPPGELSCTSASTVTFLLRGTEPKRAMDHWGSEACISRVSFYVGLNILTSGINLRQIKLITWNILGQVYIPEVGLFYAETSLSDILNLARPIKRELHYTWIKLYFQRNCFQWISIFLCFQNKVRQSNGLIS